MNFNSALFLSLLILGIFINGNSLHAQNGSRSKISINEFWQFQKENESTGKDNWEIVDLPHSWNVTDVMTEDRGYYQGVGHYRKTFPLNPGMKGKKIFLYFEGVNQEAEVKVNGRLAGMNREAILLLVLTSRI